MSQIFGILSQTIESHCIQKWPIQCQLSVANPPKSQIVTLNSIAHVWFILPRILQRGQHFQDTRGTTTMTMMPTWRHSGWLEGKVAEERPSARTRRTVASPKPKEPTSSSNSAFSTWREVCTTKKMHLENEPKKRPLRPMHPGQWKFFVCPLVQRGSQ